MTFHEFLIETKREELIDVTEKVREAVRASAVKDGLCVVYCPHTTGAITVNEGYDPDVRPDFLLGLREAFPDRREFLHAEGNSAAHIKSSVVGCSETLIVENGKLVLGQWQTIYFCEFDGPRTRRFYVKVIS
ncbi:secondary thiamine-phosphate synthase enzyme YjbQ [Synergistaceae bacterium OttesenSCG-928-D05]|nr:secondary thiamine-phosphate synthase enzyme YjbQ [Synergistaceae bacterium OttesenSCG-928-D05]